MAAGGLGNWFAVGRVPRPVQRARERREPGGFRFWPRLSWDWHVVDHHRPTAVDRSAVAELSERAGLDDPG